VPQPPPSLAERLAEAQRAAEVPARRAGELEAALRNALAREDFAAAQALKDELAGARQEAAIAGAAVAGLQTAIAEIERQREQDNRAIQEQQQHSAARERYAAALQREREGLEELDAEVASLFAGLEAVKRTYLRAVQIEHEVGQARAEQIQARVTLGEIPGPMRAVAPNQASILQDEQAVIRELLKWAGAPRRTAPQVFTGTAGPSGSVRPFGGGGLVQSSPWQ
jgi:hypothetical protein